MVDIEKTKIALKDIFRIVVLLVLLFGFLTLLTYFGFVRCAQIPGWCDVQETILGSPKVLIVQGTDGLGDPEYLRFVLSDPTRVNVRPAITSLDLVSYGNLEQYDVVIVERARTMETSKMKAFVDFATIKGGKLIWIGDSGAALPKDENKEFLLLKKERSGGVINESDSDNFIGPWARKDESGRMIALDQLLGANYLFNYCETTQCVEGQNPLVGNLVPTEKNPFVLGLKPLLKMRGNFSLVDDYGTGTRALSVNYGSKIIQGAYELGPNLPIIIASNRNKIAYYALPPEQFASLDNPSDEQYYSLIENMYFGVLGYN